jgi:hypothetical protein
LTAEQIPGILASRNSSTVSGQDHHITVAKHKLNVATEASQQVVNLSRRDTLPANHMLHRSLTGANALTFS